MKELYGSIFIGLMLSKVEGRALQCVCGWFLFLQMFLTKLLNEADIFSAWLLLAWLGNDFES